MPTDRDRPRHGCRRDGHAVDAALHRERTASAIAIGSAPGALQPQPEPGEPWTEKIHQRRSSSTAEGRRSPACQPQSLHEIEMQIRGPAWCRSTPSLIRLRIRSSISVMPQATGKAYELPQTSASFHVRRCILPTMSRITASRRFSQHALQTRPARSDAAHEYFTALDPGNFRIIIWRGGASRSACSDFTRRPSDSGPGRRLF